MKKLLCKLFGHKYQKAWRAKNRAFMYGSTHCMRCGHGRFDQQKFYYSGNDAAHLLSWNIKNVKITKKGIKKARTTKV